ncbi:MAG: AraC family transcriptional regulator [Hyphomonadaceae bacterium]|nr:AraC family transcriptional regulator [Hyphomonadaceae bacterium]
MRDTIQPAADAAEGSPRAEPGPPWSWRDVPGCAGEVRLGRLERPSGAVRIEPGAGFSIAVRINLLMRDLRPGLHEQNRLKQCVAPDYFVVVPRASPITLATHTAQAILRLDIDDARLARAGVARDALERTAGQFYADGFVAGLIERLKIDADAAHGEQLNAALIDALLYSLAAHAAATRHGRKSGGLTARQLAILREHIESRLHEPLRNADLARLVDLSPFHFARAFRKSMGAPPAVWIRLRRMTVAQKLLEDGSLTVSEIAAAVGFESPGRFARAFREAVGQGPTSFRRSLQSA